MDDRGDARPATPPSTRPADPTHAGATGAVAVVLLVDLEPRHRVWGWSRLVLGRRGLSAAQGLVFSKVLGSGEHGGFGVRPSGTHQGLFLVFADDDAAETFVTTSSIVADYRARARELFTVKLRPIAARGSWSGRQPFAVDRTAAAEPPPGSGIAALTRASIKPWRATRFWRYSPPAEASLANVAGCMLAAGLGEAPLVRQATFSIWESVPAMDRYARSGAHLDAIRAARAGRFFSEDMFVRFVPYDARGTWHGRSVPLPRVPGTA